MEEFTYEFPNLIKIKGLDIFNSNPVYGEDSDWLIEEESH